MTAHNALPAVSFDFGSLNAPAWLQALGSVLAIAVALLLSHRSHVHRRQENLLAEIRFARFALEQLDQFWSRHEETMTRFNDVIMEYLHEYDHFTLHNSKYEVDRFSSDIFLPLSLLNEMPWASWPNPELAVLFWRMYAEVEHCKVQINEWVDVPARRDGRELHDLYIDVYSAIQTLENDPAVLVEFTRFADACRAYVDWAQKRGLSGRTSYLAE